MRSIKIIWEDGNTTVTSINGTNNEIISYYVGKTFNVGDGPKDKMLKCERVEFLD